MIRRTINTRFNTILWRGDLIVDWSQRATSCDINGKIYPGNLCYLGYRFDAAIASEDHQYVFVYERLGTKGLLLKDGEIIRELNRSYYQADRYEYPVAFYTNKNGVTYIIHCPKHYNQLDIEVADSGEILTDCRDRNPDDMFHSRLEISPSGKFLLSKGWLWHPINWVSAYNLEDCIENPKLFDSLNHTPSLGTPLEFSTALFLSDDQVVLGTAEDYPDTIERYLAIWDIPSKQIIQKVPVLGEFGNFIGIAGNKIIDSFRNLKLIDMESGTISVLAEQPKLSQQQSSIVDPEDLIPTVIYNPSIATVAAMYPNKIEIFQLPSTF